MKKLFVLLLVVLSVSTLKAIEPGVNSTTAVNSVQIEGTVTDVITGEALVGVSLKVKGSEITTYTDLDGNFKMKGVSPGTYDIFVDYVSYKNITLSKVSTSSSKMNLKVQLESVSLPL